MNQLKTCKYCGSKTPVENFNCIYCGNAIFENSGFLGKLRYGNGGLFALIIVGIIVLAFIVFFIVYL